MQINHHGFTFETDEMSAFSTGEPATPTIYINQNGLAFLELRRRGWLTPHLRHIHRMEARRLARKYRIQGIMEILESETCGTW